MIIDRFAGDVLEQFLGEVDIRVGVESPVVERFLGAFSGLVVLLAERAPRGVDLSGEAAVLDPRVERLKASSSPGPGLTAIALTEEVRGSIDSWPRFDQCSDSSLETPFTPK